MIRTAAGSRKPSGRHLGILSPHPSVIVQSYVALRQRLTGGNRFPPLGIPVRAEAYRQRDDISVPTVEVWESSSRIEKKLDDLRKDIKNVDRKLEELLDRARVIRRRPVPQDFTGYLAAKREGFVGREWLFKRVIDWIAKGTKRSMLITATPVLVSRPLLRKWLSVVRRCG